MDDNRVEHLASKDRGQKCGYFRMRYYVWTLTKFIETYQGRKVDKMVIDSGRHRMLVVESYRKCFDLEESVGKLRSSMKSF